MKITVCSLRDRGEPQERDVLVTWRGPWGNPYTVRRYGWRALDLFRADLRVITTRPEVVGGLFLTPFIAALRALAGARLLCACPSDAGACHAWILAEEVDRLTGCGVEPAPGRERP